MEKRNKNGRTCLNMALKSQKKNQFPTKKVGNWGKRVPDRFHRLLKLQPLELDLNAEIPRRPRKTESLVKNERSYDQTINFSPNSRRSRKCIPDRSNLVVIPPIIRTRSEGAEIGTRPPKRGFFFTKNIKNIKKYRRMIFHTKKLNFFEMQDSPRKVFPSLSPPRPSFFAAPIAPICPRAEIALWPQK